MTSRILTRFNIKTDRLLRSIATDKLSCDIHPRKMIKMVRRVSRDHIIITDNTFITRRLTDAFSYVLKCQTGINLTCISLLIRP